MSSRVPDLDRAARAIEEFLDAVGRPIASDRELAGTGRRVAEAYAGDLLAGYAMDPAAILASGATGSTAPGLVVVTNVAAATMCPHHLLPAVGVVHVGYLPGTKVAGLGSIAELVDCFARRLVLQEDLGQSIADALVRHLGARGAGAFVDLQPTCMIARGGRRHGSRALTSAFAGTMANDAAARAELASAIEIATRNGHGAAAQP
jgi:GTP cyclohydrolase I